MRKQIGAKLEGTPVIQRVQSTYIRAPGLRAMIPGKPAWSYYSVNPRRCGTVFAIDGHSTWLVHNHLNPNEPEFDSVDRDASIRNILGVGPDFAYEVISKEDWVGPQAGGRPLPRPQRVHRRRRRAPVGALCGLRHERRASPTR